MIARLPLPYTKPPLSLNDGGITRAARMGRAATIKRTRGDASWLAMAHKLPRGLHHVTVQLHYRPRDNRRRDTDNLMATAKPLYDGLVDYGLVPDDIPAHMAKPEPIIHPSTAGLGGALWLEITWKKP